MGLRDGLAPRIAEEMSGLSVSFVGHARGESTKTEFPPELRGMGMCPHHGNAAHFDQGERWIANGSHGKNILLTKKGGCYVLSVELLAEVGLCVGEPGFIWQA